MDLSTTYLGLNLRNPIVPSASPLSENVDTILELEDAGAAAVVMHSLFEEQLTGESHRLSHYLDYGSDSFAEALTYFPDPGEYHVGPDQYLDKIRRAKESVNIPIIGSLNGITTGSWTKYARYIEEAGADALELNIYYIPTDPDLDGAEVESRYLKVVEAVRDAITIPLAVKIGPHFSAPANMARRLREAGADGLVLFNRFYQPDFDLESLDVVPRLVLSTADEMRLPLRWVGLLHGRLDLDFAITSGVRTHEDVLKGMMAGASAMMMASVLLEHGPRWISDVLTELVIWLDEHDYHSIEQMRGSMSQRNVTEPTAYERANYMKVLQSWRPDPTGWAAKN
ncbi:MAG: dihydroorotate dehydrogenase-like protein [Rhodothermales bacterium]|nr:dihydroorotate dehydrogenase-like protein [Rhodothermales bacterium]